jgi:hypothetical protein
LRYDEHIALAVTVEGCFYDHNPAFPIDTGARKWYDTERIIAEC